jgi:hypothetical protein
LLLLLHRLATLFFSLLWIESDAIRRFQILLNPFFFSHRQGSRKIERLKEKKLIHPIYSQARKRARVIPHVLSTDQHFSFSSFHFHFFFFFSRTKFGGLSVTPLLPWTSLRPHFALRAGGEGTRTQHQPARGADQSGSIFVPSLAHQIKL